MEDHAKSVNAQFRVDLHEHFRQELEKLGLDGDTARKAAYGVCEEILRIEN